MGGKRRRFGFLREDYEGEGRAPGPEGGLEDGAEARAETPDTGRAAGRAGTGAAGSPSRANALGGALGSGARTRKSRRDPKALRNDPGRTQIGPYIRRGVKSEVDRAFTDREIFPEGGGSWSHLVDGLLERWLLEVGYGSGEGRDGEGDNGRR